MAPFPLNLSRDHTILEPSYFEQRGLGNSTDPPQHLSHQDEMNLQILAVTFSSISVGSALLAFYWFVQMRRSFRHHLIMLLIQSDMFKALWFLIYPIVSFIHGPQGSTSKFCQVNGFFISLGIEASDFAILMIAIHSALYIFRPVAAAGEGGLYPYRRTAYVLWVVLPLLAASLAFINGSDTAYESQGTYCYLPIRPFWFRLALSWIPRYAIFILIVGIYAAIYFYVQYKFSNFTKGSHSDSNLSKNDDQNSLRHMKKPKQYGLPATPPLVYHGLIPETRANSFSENRTPLQLSVSTINSESEAHNSGNSENSVNKTLNTSMNYMEPQTVGPLNHQREPPNGLNGLPCNSASSLPNAEGYEIAKNDFKLSEEPNSPRPFSTASTLIAKTSSSFKPFFNRRFSPHSTSTGSKNHQSLVRMFSNLKHPDPTPTTPPSDSKVIDDDRQNLAVSEMVRTREKIRKQLRFLFIYPLVYIAMWAVPFINHVLQYSDKFAANPPYALSCATVIFVTLQCAVDCWLFSTREQPWRHMPSNEEGTFWGSFIFWSSGQQRSFPGNKKLSGPGKSRAEQVAEAKMAYKRREEEAEAWRRKDMERRSIRGMIESGEIGDEGRAERNWWDLEYDGPSMSQVVEERNPIDSEGNFAEDKDLEGKGFEDVDTNLRTSTRDTTHKMSKRDNAHQPDS